jgi:hypothetical protein
MNDIVVQEDEDAQSQHIAVCFNANAIDGETEIELARGVLLRLATSAEANHADRVFDSLVGNMLAPATHPLLSRNVRKSDGSGWVCTPITSPRQYVVLETQSFSTKIRTTALLSIAERPISFGFRLVTSSHPKLRPTKAWIPDQLFRLLNPAGGSENKMFDPISKVDLDDYRAVIETTAQWRDADWERPMRLLHQYREIRSLPEDSQFHYVALFSLVEGILAHKPKPSDPTESIGRQIRRKIALVFKRSRSRPDATAYFPNVKGDQSGEPLWNALYDLRSELAHGDTPTLVKGEGKKQVELVDLPTCNRYVDAVTRLLLRQLCAEPQLMNDLRNV